jgi:hypothetical protein
MGLLYYLFFQFGLPHVVRQLGPSWNITFGKTTAIIIRWSVVLIRSYLFQDEFHMQILYGVACLEYYYYEVLF